MDFGIVQIITLLMGLSGFSVGTNPKAPTADQALQYAMPDADIIVHFDAGSVIPNNYKVLTNLQNQPAIKAQPELAKAVRKAVAEVDGPRGLVKQMTGIDLTTDVSDATAFLQFVPQHDPNMLVSVHGKFTTATIDKLAKLTGKGSVKAAGGAWVDTGDGNAVAVTRGGVLLGGTATLVKDRMVDGWKAPALTSGTLQGVAEIIGQKPVFAVAMALSQTARTELLTKHSAPGQKPDQNFLTDIIKRHKFVGFAIYRDGIGWTWADSTKAGLDAMSQVSDGTIDILRAAQIAPRGFAKIVMGALESYRGNKQVDELIKHKADIWKLVETYSGDGQFKAAVSSDARSLKLSVRLTGKSLSEVLPLGGLLPFGVGAFFSLRAPAAPMPPPAAIAVPPLPAPTTTPPPAKKGAPTTTPPPAKKANPPKHP
jgi:hypothetical protein